MLSAFLCQELDLKREDGLPIFEIEDMGSLQSRFQKVGLLWKGSAQGSGHSGVEFPFEAEAFHEFADDVLAVRGAPAVATDKKLARGSKAGGHGLDSLNDGIAAGEKNRVALEKSFKMGESRLLHNVIHRIIRWVSADLCLLVEINMCQNTV